jgi:hypothetical protein
MFRRSTWNLLWKESPGSIFNPRHFFIQWFVLGKTKVFRRTDLQYHTEDGYEFHAVPHNSVFSVSQLYNCYWCYKPAEIQWWIILSQLSPSSSFFLSFIFLEPLSHFLLPVFLSNPFHISVSSALLILPCYLIRLKTSTILRNIGLKGFTHAQFSLFNFNGTGRECAAVNELVYRLHTIQWSQTK